MSGVDAVCLRKELGAGLLRMQPFCKGAAAISEDGSALLTWWLSSVQRPGMLLVLEISTTEIGKSCLLCRVSKDAP